MAGEPRIQYTTTSDGVSIAFTDTGGTGMPVLYMRGAPFTHAQREWQQSTYRYWFDQNFSGRRLITFDFRVCGLSDRRSDEMSVEVFTRDIEAVVERTGLEKFAVSAAYGDGIVAISYAVSNPDRVSHLILWDAYVNGPAFAEIPQTRAFLSMMENDWSLFVSTLSFAMNEWDSPSARENMEFFNESCTQEQALAFFKEYVLKNDVTDLLSTITQPTVVLSHRNMTIPDFDTVRNVAARIPNAELVVLEGTWGRPANDGPTTRVALDRLLGHATPSSEPVSTPAQQLQSQAGSLVTILFTDIEGSTELTQRLGDVKAREVFREHERITRKALVASGGSEVKTMGDGFMASFGSAISALECSIALQRAFADQPVKVRIGLNAGEPIAEAEDLFGTPVILASRIAAQAEGGEILASNVVRELVAGRGFLFADRGERILRGFEDPVRVYEVSWRED
ncbi:MAG: adenylate/guanylate cyclase domain-containing protein [Dehalococcoidia bacterium]